MQARATELREFLVKTGKYCEGAETVITHAGAQLDQVSDLAR